MNRPNLMKIYKISIILTMGLCLALSVAATAIADEPGEKAAAPALKKLFVTIEAKERGAIIANGKKYRVAPSTQIIDNTGVQLSLPALPVPCEATIYFAPVINQDARLAMIQIGEVAWGAKTGWSAPMPE